MGYGIRNTEYGMWDIRSDSTTLSVFKHLTHPDKQLPASTNRACTRSNAVLMSGRREREKKERKGPPSPLPQTAEENNNQNGKEIQQSFKIILPPLGINHKFFPL